MYVCSVCEQSVVYVYCVYKCMYVVYVKREHPIHPLSTGKAGRISPIDQYQVRQHNYVQDT